MDLSMGSRIPNNNYTGRNNLFVVILFLKIRTEEQKKKKKGWETLTLSTHRSVLFCICAGIFRHLPLKIC